MVNLAIIVGADTYQQGWSFHGLPAAKSDAVWLHRFFLNQGLTDPFIKVLVSENATRSNILRAVRQWTREVTVEPIRLFFFFSGHGVIEKDRGSPAESILITYDTEVSDKSGTGISIAELIRAFKKIELQELYIFLDACFMSIDAVARTLGEIPSLDLFRRMDTSNCYLCMVANNEGVAKELATNGLGVFTNIVLSEIENLNTSSSPTLAKLVENIQSYCAGNRTGLPYVVFAGALSGWPFYKLRNESRNLFADAGSSTHISRKREIERLLKKLREYGPASLCLFGQAGLGKTSLIYELTKLNPSAVFVRLTGAQGFGDYINNIVSEINRQNPEINTSLIDLHHDANATLSLICAQNRHILLCLDGLDDLDSDNLNELLDFFFENSIQAIFSMRDPKNLVASVVQVKCPHLDAKESLALLKTLGVQDPLVRSQIYQQAGGHPLRIIEFASTATRSDSRIDSAGDDTIVKLLTAKAFIDVEKFCYYLKVPKVDIDHLIDQGLVYNINGVWFPHDQLKDRFGDQVGTIANVDQDSLAYWCREQKFTSNLIASRVILEICESSSFTLQKFDGCISDAIMRLNRSGDQVLSLRIIERILNSNSLMLATVSLMMDILSEIGSFTLIDLIIEKLRNFGYDIESFENYKLAVSYARSCWWKGEYSAGLNISEKVIANLSDDSEIKARAFLETGIFFFFLGDWDRSKINLGIAEHLESVSVKTYGWCKLIRGSINGITGSNFAAGKMELEAAISILREEGDLTGVAVAYGNLSESLYKKGEYAEASVCVEENMRFATLSHMPINIVECKRNKLQLNLRWKGPFSEGMEELLEDLSTYGVEHIGTMELMQVANTLATVHFYRNELDEGFRHLSLAALLTLESKEYHIYSLGNYCLYYILTDCIDKATENLNMLIDLATDGMNYFAIKQVKEDIAFVYHRYGKVKSRHLYTKIENHFNSLQI